MGAATGSGSVSARISGAVEVSRKSSAEPFSETRLNTTGNGLLGLHRRGGRPFDDRSGQGSIRVGPFRAPGILENRHSGQGRLRKPDAVLDDDIEDDVAVPLSNQLQHFLGVQRPRLVDRRQDAADAQLWVQL